jgi:hypothetical protein
MGTFSACLLGIESKDIGKHVLTNWVVSVKVSSGVGRHSVFYPEDEGRG